jgi:Skp family chaperone for outer membrane proteins
MYRTLLTGLLAASVAAPTLAAPSTPSADGAPLGGPQIAGLCSLSQQAVFANAKVALAAAARLKRLTEESQAEIAADRAPIEADAKALDAQRASLKPDELQKRQQALAPRIKALQDKAALRAREIEATREKALGRITLEMRPVIAQVYGARGCGLLIDRGSILGGNMAGDLTAAVVQGLDGRITTLDFDRESLAAAPTAASR